MSVCDPEEGMHAFFADALASQYMMAVPDTPERLAALEKLLAEKNDIAAILIEPRIQGAGGMRMHGKQVLQTLRALADRHNVLLIFDEIFTGFGRTGEMFAADTAQIVPDIMVLGKALTGGVTPLAATIVSDKVYAPFDAADADKALMHGPTFTGHALACAVALASLDLFEQTNRLAQVRHLHAFMQNALAGLADDPRIGDIRVLGAVGVVETNMDFDIEAARAWFIDQGVFIRPLGRVIYLTPAYTISDTEVTQLTDAIAAFIATL
jgi:adenosylmethionine-8-amino-7-oxononanoate aminotransferase